MHESEAFKVCPMRLINLNDNILTQKGAMAIADAVEVLPNLETLDLGDCLVRSEGLRKLTMSLKQCPKIKHLNFAFGEVRLEAALDLVNVLSLDKIKSLDLNGNKFGDEGNSINYLLINNVLLMLAIYIV